jgi:hypothetical protein
MASREEDKAWADYSERFRREVLPHLLDSAMFLSIGTDVGEFDVKQATELGAALLYDKPLLLVVPPGRSIGRRLRRAADVVIDDFDPTQPETQERITAALKQLTGGVG